MTLAQSINGWLRRVPAWTLYVVFALWGGWYFYLALTRSTGIWTNQVQGLEHVVGLLALKILIAILAITPIRTYTGINLVKFRRALGVSAFFLVLYHFLVWWFLDVQTLGRVVADIIKRPYITIGMGALVLLLPLAVTSNNLSIRKLGPLAWRRLHWLTYPAVLLAAVHFVWLRKGWQLEPLTYLAIIVALLLLRVKWRRLALALPGLSRG
ncbi:sulfite oxidase heme-binding subunit YedZ [Frigidibacter sp. ROC022]|uniref:sulfite oxidase heme-binding subunit YedZ n=1 Tax=Frigidibacter sp. ROC022 TaxID=2971796 RepID=UPI00215A4470|nr:ferric reductase-like transmembrane domain-containing protein [Frigidibacter sp. ROC022]MCR8724295.1 ferric reductase-like transmembrane domain-containing protein [Frigidibacter sp. ROC022]